jgi:hypothetical protein
LRDGVKVSDFISPEAMSNLKNLTIGNKAICIDFFKDIKYNSRVKDFARIPWDLRGLPWSQRFVKTEDGFYLMYAHDYMTDKDFVLRKTSFN